jgi:hypothetical protein
MLSEPPNEALEQTRGAMARAEAPLAAQRQCSAAQRGIR